MVNSKTPPAADPKKMKLQKYRVHLTVIITISILLVGAVLIFWARGFKPDLKNRTIDRTGLIVATSIPTGAQVYLNDRLTSATDTNIVYLDPGIYKIRIQKDGYSVWQKDIEVKADLSTEIKALLFPTAPQISPLTQTGASNPVLSPDNTKIVFGVPGIRGGVFILNLAEGFFAFKQDPKLIIANQDGFDFSKAKFIFSPDSKQAIASFEKDTSQTSANILIDTDKTQQELRDITNSLNATLSGWQEDLIDRAQLKALVVPDEIKSSTAEAKQVNSSQLTVNSKDKTVNSEPSTVNQLNYYPTGLIFSPDEEKILFKDKNSVYLVFDLKNLKKYTLPAFSDLISLSWYPDSSHLVVAQNNQISIVEADGNNKMVIYSGKFENGFVFAHPSGQRLIILTALTQADGTSPNLYSINLK